MSSSISFLKASPVGPPGFTAIAASRSLTRLSDSALVSASSSFLTIGAGVPAGAKNPLQSLVFTAGNPDSAMLGTSGNSGERSEPVTASARALPPFTSGIAGGPSDIVKRLCPDTTLKFDSLLLLYGIATAGIPLLSLNNSVVIVNAGEDVP